MLEDILGQEISTKVMEENEKPLRLLSLDSGVIRGFSELLILEKLMIDLKGLHQPNVVPKPAEVFDLIGGTGTGGWIALMLGRLNMSVSEAIDEYKQLSQTVFSTRQTHSIESGHFDFRTLENALRDMMSRTGHGGETATEQGSSISNGSNEDLRLLETTTGEGTCKVFVCAKDISTRNLGTRLFTSYTSDWSEGYEHVTILQAARATSAAPFTFNLQSVRLLKEMFVDWYVSKGEDCINPVKQVISEAKRVFGPKRPLACIVSIGAGKSGEVRAGEGSPFETSLPLGLLQTLHDTNIDAEKVQREIAEIFRSQSHIYYRLNVDQGLQKIGLDEWEDFTAVQESTIEYLLRAEIVVTRARQALLLREQGVPLSEIRIS